MRHATHVPYLLGRLCAVLQRAEGQPMHPSRLNNYLAAPVSLLAESGPLTRNWSADETALLTEIIAQVPVSTLTAGPLTLVEIGSAMLGYYHEQAAGRVATVGTSEWAQLIGVEPSVARRYLAGGRVPGAVKVGTDWSIPAASLKPAALPAGVKPGRRRLE